MSKLFIKKEDSDLRSVRCQLRFTEAEDEAIRESAKDRSLSVSEFIRRAALGRKADLKYEKQIVLQLIDVVRAIRQIHKGMVDRGMSPPEEIWLPIIECAEQAMLRISK